MYYCYLILKHCWSCPFFGSLLLLDSNVSLIFSFQTSTPRKMSSKAYSVLLVLVLIESSISFYYPHEKNGKYCGSRLSRGLTECCTDRKDDCHERIDGNWFSYSNSKLTLLIFHVYTGTLCYCDQFCDRTHNGDCCPDYERVCKSSLSKPPESHTKGCKDGNLFVAVGKSFMRNCNKW